MTAPAIPRPALLGAGRGARARTAAARFGTPRILVLALAAFLAIAFARAHELFSFLIPLRLGKLIGLPLVIVAYQRLPRAQMRAALRTGPSRGAIAIGLMMLLSVPLSIWIGNSVGYLRTTAYVTVITFLVTASVLVDRRAIPTILATEVIAVGLGATRMLLPNPPTVFEENAMRVFYGFSYDPNDCAALFLLTIPLALYLAGRLQKWRLLWYGLAAIMVAALVRTGSRGGLLGFGALVATLAVLAPPRQRARLAGAAAAAVLGFSVLVSQNKSLSTRFASTFDSSESDYNYTSTNGRIEIWKRGLYYMATHPVTGVGVANFPTAEYQIGSELKAAQGITDRHMLTAHNSEVQIGAELGVPGLAAYLYMLGSAMLGMWRRRRQGVVARGRGKSRVPGVDDEIALASAVLTALVAIFVAGSFLSLAYSPITLFACALAAGVLAGGPSVAGQLRPNYPTASGLTRRGPREAAAARR